MWNSMCGILLWLVAGLTPVLHSATNQQLTNVSRRDTEPQTSIDCGTKECVSLSNEMISSMDNTIRPCEDFYRYACGGWIKKHVLPLHSRIVDHETEQLPVVRNLLAEGVKSTDSSSVRKAKDYYYSCINRKPGNDENKTLTNYITRMFREWPLTCPDCVVDDINIDQYIYEATKVGAHPLFKLQVVPQTLLSPGQVPVKSYRLKVGAPVLGFPLDYYHNTLKQTAFRTIYENAIYTVAQAFKEEHRKVLIYDLEAIVKVEARLAELFMNHNTSRLGEIKLRHMTKSYGKNFINWSRLLNSLLAEAEVNGRHDSYKLMVEHPGYLQQAIKYFSRLDARTQANYIIWRVVDTLLHSQMDPQEKIENLMRRAIRGKAYDLVSDEACTKLVSARFNKAVLRLLADRHFNRAAQYKVLGVFRNLQNTFPKFLSEQNWMEDITRYFVTAKSRNINLRFFPTENHADIDLYYEHIHINKETFLLNVISERKDSTYQTFRLLSSTPENIIYAGLGIAFARAIIGAQMGEAMNVNGTLYESWWDSDSVRKFKELAFCFALQYRKFFYKAADQYIHGMAVVNDSVVENGALNLAYRAYEEHIQHGGQTTEPGIPELPFSNGQVFFLRYAQNHCAAENQEHAQMMMMDNKVPDEVRVNGALKNSYDFARLFNCPKDSPMNPTNKCQVW